MSRDVLRNFDTFGDSSEDAHDPAASLSVPNDEPGHLLTLRLIGQMEVRGAAGDNLLPHGRKTRALLAAVALSAPRPALRLRLAELLWSRRPEEQARASLRQEVHRLLEALGPETAQALVITRNCLSLRPGVVRVDVDEVMRATTVQDAPLTLLDGELLDGLDGINPEVDAWLASERERLRDRARTLAENLLSGQKEPGATIVAAQRLLQIDLAHEGAWRALMRAHAARGENGLAVQAYGRCRTVLADLMDAAPSQETQKLLAEIRGPAGIHISSRQPQVPGQKSGHLDPSACLAPSAEAPVAPGSGWAPGKASGNSESATGPCRPRSAPCVGVLPLRPIGSGGEEVQLAQALAGEITAALSRFHWLSVVAASHQAADCLGAVELGSGGGFLVDGTVQKGRGRIRITVRLIDTRGGGQVAWARHFDHQADDLLALQDDIAAEVAAQIEPEILLFEARRSASRPEADADAHDSMLRAVPLIGCMDRAQFMKAGGYLAKAIGLEPEYAAPHAWYAYWHVFLVGQDWAEAPKASIGKAAQLAERAIVIDPSDARAFAIAGHVRGSLQRRPGEAAVLHERALSLNPNLAMAWALSAAAHAYLGDTAEAERRTNHYKRLSPLDPHAFLFDGFFILIHLLKRDFEAAADMGRAVIEMNPSFTGNFKPYLAALGHLGRTQEAATVLRRLLALEPGFSVARHLAATPIRRESDRKHYADGLRLAGVPEAHHGGSQRMRRPARQQIG